MIVRSIIRSIGLKGIGHCRQFPVSNSLEDLVEILNGKQCLNVYETHIFPK
ncbi:hypothetical protein QTP88_024181 [Uroleucon formosanum]